MTHHASKASQIINKTLPAYFAQKEKSGALQPESCDVSKMATTGNAVMTESALVTKADIQDLAGRLETLEKGFLTKLTELIHPLTEKLDQLSLSLQIVNAIAEGAMDLSVVQQEEIKELQEYSESHEERLAILGNHQRSLT